MAGKLALDSLPPALYQGASVPWRNVERRPGTGEDVKTVAARLLVLGAAVGSMALLAGAVMLVLRLAQPTEYPVDLSRGTDGEIVGRVAKIEPGAILVSSELPGSGVVPLVVTKDTRFVVGGIEGRMNDVRPGGQIKVAYDLYEGKRLARSVEVLPEQDAQRPAAVEPPPKAAAKPKPGDLRPAAPPAAATSTLNPVAPAKPTPAPPPQPGTPAPRPKAEPPRVAQPKPATPAPATSAPARPAPAPSARPAPAVATPAPPQEPDPDGSAAVDWLLKGRR